MPNYPLVIHMLSLGHAVPFSEDSDPGVQKFSPAQLDIVGVFQSLLLCRKLFRHEIQWPPRIKSQHNINSRRSSLYLHYLGLGTEDLVTFNNDILKQGSSVLYLTLPSLSYLTEAEVQRWVVRFQGCFQDVKEASTLRTGTHGYFINSTFSRA